MLVIIASSAAATSRLYHNWVMFIAVFGIAMFSLFLAVLTFHLDLRWSSINWTSSMAFYSFFKGGKLFSVSLRTAIWNSGTTTSSSAHISIVILGIVTGVVCFIKTVVDLRYLNMNPSKNKITMIFFSIMPRKVIVQGRITIVLSLLLSTLHRQPFIIVADVKCGENFH